MIIDSHCHLDYQPLFNNLDDVIKRANKNGVKYFLTISTTDQSFINILDILKKHKIKGRSKARTKRRLEWSFHHGSTGKTYLAIHVVPEGSLGILPLLWTVVSGPSIHGPVLGICLTGLRGASSQVL